MKNARPFLMFLVGAAAGAGIVYAVTREELINDINDLARRARRNIADRLGRRESVNVMGEEVVSYEEKPAL